MALFCDAIIGNVQEKSIKTYNATNAEVVLYSYFLGFLYIFSVMLLTGDLADGLEFFSHVLSFSFTTRIFLIKFWFQNPRRMYGYAFIFSLTGYLGIQVVLTLVRTTGAFAAVTVTTMRKAMTIIISFIFFSKPFTFQYALKSFIKIK